MGAAAVQAQQKEKKVKDQAEYDLYTNSTKATDPSKRLTFLNTWKEKYPDSDFKEERLLILMTTYQQLNQPGKMVDTAKEILATDPKQPNALLAVTALTMTYPAPPTADSLATGEKAAQGLLNADKPVGVTDDAAWQKIRLVTAYTTLGFVAMQRKQYDEAEQDYKKILAADPTNAWISNLLGTAIFSQKKPERYPEVLYEWARAASLTGAGAVPEAARKPVDASFVKLYNAYHGPDDAGMKELRAQAIGANPLPPDGFKIKNKNEIEAEKQDQFAKANPSLALWKTIKDSLTGPTGDMYFESSMKGAALPGGANGVTKFQGKLVSMKPALNPKELVLAISTADTPEVTLKFEAPLHGKADPGTEISFEGVASAFTKDPFMVTFDVDKAKVDGWPAQAAPPVRKRPTVHKKQ